MATRAIVLLLLATSLAACTTPAPPRPAMQPLAIAGNFGFTDRKIDTDTIEVTYRGAEVKVNSRNARNDSRVAAEKVKVRDLALLHGTKLAKEQGAVAIRIVNEKVDSDVDVRSRPSCRPGPLWGGIGAYGYPYRYGYGYGGWGWPGPYYYDCYESRWAKAKAMATLTLDLLPAVDANDVSVQPVDGTITRLEKTYAGATYP